MSETTAAAPRAGDHHPGAYPARDRTVGRRLAPPGDYLTMAARCARLTSREIDAAAMSLFLPVMLMVIFVYLFGGAVSTGTRYITYVVPGVLLLCAGIGIHHHRGAGLPGHDLRHHRPLPLHGRGRPADPVRARGR